MEFHRKTKFQRELAGMMDDDIEAELSRPAPAPKQHPTPPKRAADEPPPIPDRGAPPVPPQRTESTAPAIPERSTPAELSAKAAPPSAPVKKLSQPEPKPAPSETIPEAEQVRRELRKRFEAFAVNLKLANEANDLPNAKEFAAMVEMFEQAIQTATENDLTMADLAEVPGMPPPYKV